MHFFAQLLLKAQTHERCLNTSWKRDQGISLDNNGIPFEAESCSPQILSSRSLMAPRSVPILSCKFRHCSAVLMNNDMNHRGVAKTVLQIYILLLQLFLQRFDLLL